MRQRKEFRKGMKLGRPEIIRVKGRELVVEGPRGKASRAGASWEESVTWELDAGGSAGGGKLARGF